MEKFCGLDICSRVNNGPECCTQMNTCLRKQATVGLLYTFVQPLRCHIPKMQRKCLNRLRQKMVCARDYGHKRLQDFVYHTCWSRDVCAPMQHQQSRNLKTKGNDKQNDLVTSDDTVLEPKVLFPQGHIVDDATPKGKLSPAARNTIEQFSRLNGSTGKKMKANFETYASVDVQNEARNLVEFCCFRYFSRCGADFHPSLQDAAFRRLVFDAMLGWQDPYTSSMENAEQQSLQLDKVLVGESAFIRFAPAIPGVADRATVHNLFSALCKGNEGLSFETWDCYIVSLCRILDMRIQHKQEYGTLLELEKEESVICVGESARQPILKWDKNIMWPGRLTLTNYALYFQPYAFTKHNKAVRLDLRGDGAKIDRNRVRPFDIKIIDSAISIFPSQQSDPWVLEFVDLHGKRRRDFWHASIHELISLYQFIREYAPEESDPAVKYIYGAKMGKQKALNSFSLGVARLQAIQSVTEKPLKEPEKLLQFFYLANARGGELVLQTLAVGFWGGRMELNPGDPCYLSRAANPEVEDKLGVEQHAIGTDGSVYLSKWMTSSTWKAPKSISFWKQKVSGQGLVLGKNHVVGGLSQTERAVLACRGLSKEAEIARATIDGALVQGIPENIELFKELLLPFSIGVAKLHKLRSWEEPMETVIFLLSALTILYRNWIRFVIPSILILGAAMLFSIRALRAEGQVAGDFGKITIREPPPSNTIQKFIALKEALAVMESHLQTVNITLLKLRTLFLSGPDKALNIGLLVLVGAAATFLFVPFNVLCAIVMLDQFTQELQFRKPMAKRFIGQLKDWWETIPAAPVVVLPHEKDAIDDLSSKTQRLLSKVDGVPDAIMEWLVDN